ncbi:MAG: thiolase domain-containing protein [Candidatus Heimdallarchaeota archaeon]
MGRIAIVGIGHGRFGRRDDVNIQELAFEPVAEALNDAGVERKDIGATLIGSSPEYMKQRSLSGPVTEYLGLNPQPVWLTEAACGSSAAAFRTAVALIKADMHACVLVLGLQKMLELSTPELLSIMGRSGDVQWESNFGTTFASYYAMYAKRHMHVHGTTPEQLAAVAIKNHNNALKNPLAMFQKPVTMERIMSSRMIASPLRLFDCCANADGAAAAILASEEVAKRLTDTPIWLEGTAAATAPFSVLTRPDLTSLPSAVKASKDTFKQANVTSKDVDVAEVHDCFTIAEIMAYEDIGFCEKGRGGKFVEEGESDIGGTIPVNPDGGLKAKGHPVGATGTSQIVEVVKQLRGEAGNRQVDGSEVGLTHNVGGHGQYCFVNIFRR